MINLKKHSHASYKIAVIHGDYDPHPYPGAKKPLIMLLKYFKFILHEKCGHTLWIEKEARDEFYSAWKKELFGKEI